MPPSLLCRSGPSYDLSLTEVRDHSLVVEWEKPLYTGCAPITGYHVEYCKKGTSDWITANETAVNHRFLKVREFTCKKVDYFNDPEGSTAYTYRNMTQTT